ncbi:MAG: tripartite tricarboxylate transporter TctB family protein [Pseudomonadota bacterium]
MKIKSQQDFWTGLLFLILGVAFAVGVSDHAMGNAKDPGPGYFPLALSAVMVLLGAVILFFSLTFETDGGQPIGPMAWRPLLVVTGAIVLFGMALPVLGLLLTSPLVVLVSSLAMGKPHWPGLWWSGLLLTLAAYLVLVVGLGLPLPVGPAGP